MSYFARTKYRSVIQEVLFSDTATRRVSRSECFRPRTIDGDIIRKRRARVRFRKRTKYRRVDFRLDLPVTNALLPRRKHRTALLYSCAVVMIETLINGFVPLNFTKQSTSQNNELKNERNNFQN